MSGKGEELQFFGRRPPEVTDVLYTGKLFVVEGADGSGRSTQISQLAEWLEVKGYAVRHMGLRRSPLLAEDIEHAKQSTLLTHTTMSLFYATDFFDQLVHEIFPALRAGYIVLADRYVYTLMVRELVRGTDPKWARNLYGPAPIPHAVFYLQVSADKLVARTFQKNATLDYWESGMDLGLARDMFDSFLKYQGLLTAEFQRMQQEFGFTVINGDQDADTIQGQLRHKIGTLLGVSDEKPAVERSGSRSRTSR
jgi:dTMP kinase